MAYFLQGPARRWSLVLLLLAALWQASAAEVAPAAEQSAAEQPKPKQYVAVVTGPTTPKTESTQQGNSEPEPQYVLLQYRSAERARHFVETAILRHVLSRDYEPVDVLTTTADAPGSERKAWTFRQVTDSATRTLEMVLAPFPGGGFELYLYGEEISESDNKPKNNSDLPKIKAGCDDLLKKLGEATLGGPNDRLLTYPLSYVQADRAVATLKSLGYPVIEYSEKKWKPNEQRPIAPDQIFTPEETSAFTRPVVINLIDSEATTLVKQETEVGWGRQENTTITGGQTLGSVTDAVPQQRLLIVWDERDRASLDELLGRLQKEIDFPARQILIEALVIEVDKDRLLDLGVDFEISKDNWKYSFLESTDEAGLPLALPFTYTWNQPAAKTFLTFMGSLRALADRGEAKVLSRPSVLVLDNRQARIKVAEEIPYTKEIQGTAGGFTIQNTAFLTAGIILNLRPRATFDNSEVSMQVETIISSAGPARVLPETGALIAPTIQSRQVQTIVRVSNDTPFVIGGLISLTDQNQRVGVPGLMKIPFLGRLFRKENVVEDRKEVIVVITPHIIEEDDRRFAYTIPRDDEIFDSFGAELFRNVYRLRASDVFDLSFIYANPTHKDNLKKIEELAREFSSEEFTSVPPVDRDRLIRELEERSKTDLRGALGEEALDTFLTFFSGDVPGEEILVQRMMIELLERPDPGRKNLFAQPPSFDDYVPLEKVRLFQNNDIPRIQGLDTYKKCDLRKDTLIIEFRQAPSAAIQPPHPDVWCQPVCPTNPSEACFLNDLRARYKRGTPAIFLNKQPLFRRKPSTRTDSPKQHFEELLQSVLALERMLELNHCSTCSTPTFPLTLKAFHVGREVVFPTREDLQNRDYVIDRRTARLFYETLDYYRAFSEEYSRRDGDLKTRLATLSARRNQSRLQEWLEGWLDDWSEAWSAVYWREPAQDQARKVGAYRSRYSAAASSPSPIPVPPKEITSVSWSDDPNLPMRCTPRFLTTGVKVACIESAYLFARTCEVEYQELALVKPGDEWEIANWYVETPRAPCSVDLYARLQAGPPPEKPGASEVLAAVDDWEDAWERQRVDDYLAAYSGRFVPPPGQGRWEWKRTRRERVARPARIAIVRRHEELTLLTPDRAEARFEQLYRSNLYCDIVDKTLLFAYETGGWKIISEEARPRKIPCNPLP